VRRAGLALLAAVIATAGVVGTAASEDDDRAAALADEADARARAGDYVGAAALFRQAHAIEPRPEYQCNVGIAYYKAKELPRAQLYLGVCLTRGSHLPEAFFAQVRAALAAVEDRLRKGDFTPVDVVVAPASAEVSVSSFAAGETFVGARTLWLPFGAHTLEARAEGYVTGTVELTLDSRAAVTAALTLEPAPVVDEAAPPDAGVAEPGADAAPVPVPDAGVGAAVRIEAHAAPSRLPAYLATGATVVAAGATVWLYGRAADAAERAGGLTEAEGYAAAAEDARGQRTLAYAGYAVTALAAVTTGYLWWRVTRAPEGGVVVTPAVTEDGAGAWVMGRF
jgi:tetratricopeptide (TPR) repeat protein